MPLEGEYAPSPRKWVRNQAETYERSGGTKGTTIGGKPVVLVTMLGARSGKIRKVPLMKIEHGGRYALVASDNGGPKNPVWYHNLRAHPRVELRDGPVTREMTAREITGEEKRTWWERAIAVWPDYAKYQRRTDRQIPVFLLEPADYRS